MKLITTIDLNFPNQASAVCEPWTSDVQAGFRKARGTTDQIANIHWIIKKAREFQKMQVRKQQLELNMEQQTSSK